MNRTVLVTGAGRRIGATLARALAAAGWRVVLHANRSVAEAEAVAHDIQAAGGSAGVIAADLSDRDAIDGLIGRAVKGFGPLHALVNNAASFRRDGIADTGWATFDAHLVPNLAAPLFLSRDFARQFAATPADGPAGVPSGVIVNLLDQKLANLNPDFLTYTLSKVALGGLTHMLAMALAPRIRVNGVSPGLTLISGKQTPESFERAWHATPLGRSSTPEELAAAVRFILDTPSMTGQTIVLDGGESLIGRGRDVSLDPSLAASGTAAGAG